ncbi:hypothetical protein VNO77_37160 [Canavalia gladiata]|uniref:Uncharacterized protein n=1 Tax=Canavalia gladiata TaxID=3824 RepID=A0AAN9KA89_CANGL
MSKVTSSLPVFANDAIPTSNITRHCADFHPTIWGDYFLAYLPTSTEGDTNMKQIQILEEDVRKKLVSPIDDNFSFKLNFIDSVQRLGVSYHFEREIDEALHQIYCTSTNENNVITHNDDLHHLALLFRLLRQAGYRISSSVFYQFKDQTENFNERVATDIEGMLGLYEAAQLRVHGEEILDEAHNFTHTHLTKYLTTQLSPSLATKVRHSLGQSLRKGMPRLEARYYMYFYQEDPSHDENLLTFAKLDFNILQKLHQKEVSSITKWDICCVDDLPEYMRLCYTTLLNIFEEIEQELKRQGKACCIKYAKKEMKRLVQAYITEARWFHCNHTPTMEEYMQVATISCGFSLLTTISFIGMEDTTEEIYIWATSDPIIIVTASIICRLMDDIVGSEFEQKRGHVASSVECYMKQYNSSREDGIEELRKLIESSWKDMNEECLNPTQVPMPFLMRTFNLARMMDVLYKDEDSYTNAGGIMKHYIQALLVDKMPV